jgi:hypothetical protein
MADELAAEPENGARLPERYLGDGLFASFDGFSVTLRAPRWLVITLSPSNPIFSTSSSNSLRRSSNCGLPTRPAIMSRRPSCGPPWVKAGDRQGQNR